MITQDKLKQLLCDLDYGDVVLFECPDYASAFVGVSEVGGAAVYDYELMVRHLMDEDCMSEEEAMEFIDYNTIRPLPYVKGKQPIIIHRLTDYPGFCDNEKQRE